MYQEIILENNLTLVYEKLPYVRTVSFGLWVGTGSRYETPKRKPRRTSLWPSTMLAGKFMFLMLRIAP